MKRATLTLGLLAFAMTAPAESASAAWQGSGQGSGWSKAKTMPAGNQPTASVSNRDVTVSWGASSFSGGPDVSGYDVKRYATDGTAQSIGSNCSGTVSGLSCTEGAVPPGSWKYSVMPKHGSNWRGVESPQSAAVSVQSPSLSFTSATTVTSLPATLNGNISNFISGQTVTFKLDNPSTGTTLSGSINPSPVPSSGAASFSVTIPAGTSNGSHTVYAVGNQGDTASGAITVNSCAGTQTVLADADSWVSGESKTTNFGTDSNIWVRAGAETSRTLVHFTLPAMGSCTLSAATLKLYAGSVTSTDGQIRTLQAFRLASIWGESTVTWNNQPAVTGTAATTPSAVGWRSWNVTSHVQAMYGGTNTGFLVRDSSETGGSQRWISRFDSREGTNDPQLEITLADG